MYVVIAYLVAKPVDQRMYYFDIENWRIQVHIRRKSRPNFVRKRKLKICIRNITLAILFVAGSIFVIDSLGSTHIFGYGQRLSEIQNDFPDNGHHSQKRLNTWE